MCKKQTDKFIGQSAEWDADTFELIDREQISADGSLTRRL